MLCVQQRSRSNSACAYIDALEATLSIAQDVVSHDSCYRNSRVTGPDAAGNFQLQVCSLLSVHTAAAHCKWERAHTQKHTRRSTRTRTQEAGRLAATRQTAPHCARAHVP